MSHRRRSSDKRTHDPSLILDVSNPRSLGIASGGGPLIAIDGTPFAALSPPSSVELRTDPLSGADRAYYPFSLAELDAETLHGVPPPIPQ